MVHILSRSMLLKSVCLWYCIWWSGFVIWCAIWFSSWSINIRNKLSYHSNSLNTILVPVRQRIHFRILLITYKSINDMAPEYLSELVSIRKSFRKLRSSSQILLQVPVSRLKSYGNCVFSVAAPTLWNRLPADIRNASYLENV